ncbi:MAG: hypothetical protein NTX15_11260 [Candidatus Kapabacteria bacterium]|nr:hypothetical protein [Candidatus Kapabacteria bacterium]
MFKISWLLVLLIMCCLTSDLRSQITGVQQSEYFSSLRVGDTVAVYDDDTADFHLIIIATTNSCQMAGQSFDPIRQNLAAKGLVRAQLYVATEDPDFPKRLQETYQWQFRSEIDPLGAYQKLYRVHHPPVGVITDRHGVVLAVGPIGKSVYDWGAEISRIPIATRVVLDLERNLKEIDRTRLQESESIIAAGFQRFVVMLSDTVVSVCALPLSRLDLFHTNGKHLAGTAIKKEGSYTPFMPLQAMSPMGSKGPLLVELEENGRGIVILEYDMDLKERRITRPRLQFDSGAFLRFNFSTDKTHTLLASVISPADSVGFKQPLTGTTLWSLSSGDQIMTFDREVCYSEANLSNYFWGSQVISDDEVAVCYSLGDSLSIRDRKTGSIRRVKIDYDTTIWRTKWRQKFRDLLYSTPIEDIMAFSVNVSTHGTLTRDASNGAYYAEFMNQVKPDEYEVYITGPIGSPRCRTRRVGKNVMCHAVNKNILYTTLSSKGALYLIRYSL